MPNVNYENLRNDRCPYCNSKLHILICGRRECHKEGCHFTMSEGAVERMLAGDDH